MPAAFALTGLTLASEACCMPARFTLTEALAGGRSCARSHDCWARSLPESLRVQQLGSHEMSEELLLPIALAAVVPADEIPCTLSRGRDLERERKQKTRDLEMVDLAEDAVWRYVPL